MNIPILFQSCVFYVPWQETTVISGGTVSSRNAAGTVRNGTLLINGDNTFSLVSSKYGRGGALTRGTGNSCVKFGGVDTLPELLVTDELSLAAWIYPTDSTANLIQTILGCQKDTGFGYSILFDNRLNPDGQTSPRQHLHFQMNSSGFKTTNVNGFIPTNTWTFVTATRKRGESAVCYYNAVSQALTSVAWTTGNITNGTNVFAIGMQEDYTASRQFAGSIVMPMVFNKKLTQQEVNLLYRITKGQFLL